MNFFLYLFMHVFDLLRALLLFLVAQSCLTLCDPMDYSPPGSSVHGILQARIVEQVAMPSSRGSYHPRDQTQVSHIWAESLMSEPPGKPKNTGMGSLSLLQQIFRTQESNWGLLPCRRILYQLSHQRGKPPADGSKALPSRAGSLPHRLTKVD